MSDKGDQIYIYAIRDEESVKGFILVASDSDVDVENSKAEKVEVFHIHSIKNKPYNYTLNKKVTTVRLEEFMSVVDDELYEYNPRTRTVTFDQKGYDNLIGQLMDDLEEEQSEEESDDGKKKSSKKKGSKVSTQPEVVVKQRGRPKATKAKESENESYQAEEEPEVKPKAKGRGRPKRVQSDEDKEEEEEEEEVVEKPKGKRGRPPTNKSKPLTKSFKEDKKKNGDEEEEEDDEEEEEEQNEKEDEEEEYDEEAETKSKVGKRGRKPGKKAAVAPQKKETTGKRGRKPKKVSDSEDNEEEDEEEAPKKGGKKKVEKVEKFKKGSTNPNVPDVIKVDETFEGNSQDIADQCCTFCTNRELLRAVYTGNHALLKKLVQSKAKISTLFAKRGPDSDDTVLEIIIKNKDKKALEIIIAALQKKSDLSFASNPECSLEEAYTGFNDRFAYGVPTRRVQISRGGKEGNNAFVSDITSFVETENWHSNQRLIFSLLENETEVQFLEFLRGLKDEQLTTSLLEKTYVAVRAGNRKTAAYLMEQANKFGGYGFNKVHEQVLTLDDPSKMDEFRKVSATKKSQGVYSNNSYGYGGAQGVITPIHCAAINPNPEFIKKLLELAPEFTIPDDLMRKPIHYAATCEGPGPLSYLIKQGVDTREGDKKKVTPLMLAAQFGRAKNIEVLLEANGKSNPDTRTREGMRAIHYAAHYGHLECVKLLIEKGGVEVDSPGSKRMTPLHIAASRGHFEMVEYLLSKGAKGMAKDKFRRSAIIHATANGYLKILSLLLKSGGPFNDPDSSNNTPVHYAAAYGFQSCLDLLKQAGADFNPQNAWNLTPLSVSMAKGHFGMVKKLLNYPECDVNCTDVEGRTIISRATEKLNLNNIVQFEFILKDKKANPNMSDLKGQSPLHYLCNLSKTGYIQKRQKEENKYNITKKYEDEYEKIIEKATQILLECGADINKLNISEQSPLIIAIKQKNFFILNILLKKGGLEFNFVNKIDQNIFHILSSLIMEGPSGIEQFQSLFEEIKKDKGINVKEYINKVDYHGFTPLLQYVKTFSENATLYRNQRFEEIKKEMFEKKGGSTNKKAGNKQQSTPISGFGTDGTLIQLTEKEIEKAQKQADEDLQKFEKDFQKLITFLVAQGADIQSKVQKIRKDTMDVEEKDGKQENEEEDDQNEDEEDEEQNQQNIQRDNMGNPIDKKKQKYTPHYNSYGEMNVFGLALRHLSLTYLKFFVEQYPNLINNVDYLSRNILAKFIIQNTDFKEKNDKQTLTHSILEWLSTLKIDINHRDVIESTPLITAISQNKFEFAKILINHKASLDVKDIFGKSPLIMAINTIKSNNLEFIEFLLSQGACPNFKDNYGRSSLHHAVNVADKGANASFDLENLLIKNGADVNIQDSLGRTPLHYCFTSLTEYTYNDIQYDPFETVSSLCNQPHIKIDTKDNLLKTPLHYAAQKNSTISAIYMVEKGASIDSEDINGNTPLSIAFRFQRSEITTTFIQNKADTSKMITVLKNLKPNGEEYAAPKEVKKDMWGNPIRGARKSRPQRRNQRYQQYGSRYINYNEMDNDNSNGEDQGIINVLLTQYQLEAESYTNLIQNKLVKEAAIAKDQDKIVFAEFKQRGSMPVGKSSFFKAAITYQWQGIAYLLLIKSNYNLFNALEDAINIDLYQLSITLLFKYPEDNTITQTNSQGQNLLHILAKRPPKDANLQVKLFDTLISRHVDYKKQDEKKNLCIHFAYLHPQLTPKLLDLGLDCNSLNEDVNTPFSYAIQKNAKQALHIYTSKYKPDYSKQFKAKAEGFNESFMFTPLIFQFANRVKDLHLLSSLLTNGSIINETDSLGRSSLYYAIYHNSTKLVKFVLQSKKLDIKHLDNNGKNAIHYVVNPVEFGSYENIEILELLQNAKFDLNVKDKEGNTPMSYALLQDSKKMADALKKFNVEAPKDKKLPKRAPTSIVATADFPVEEVDFEEDSKKFSEDSAYDQYKEFFEQKNSGDKISLDKYVSSAYKKKENYVVLDENNEAYNLLMTKVDLGFGGYSKYVFYAMQVIHDKNSGIFILYTRWGQMGQMGQMQHTPFPTKEAAVKEFSKIFLQKAGNEWTNRHSFQKQEKKYQLIVFDKVNDKKAFSIKPYDFNQLVSKPSQLDKPIQEFIKNISNAEIFKTAFSQLALSDQYMPLTKLSKSTLIEAQGILVDLKEEIEEIQALRSKLTQGNNMQRLLEREEHLLKLSNRYYELVPRAASKWESVNPLVHTYHIAQEQRLVENLLDFEAAIKIIMGSYTKLAIQHPLDYCYSSLNIRVKQVELEHPEYKMIQQYISRTNKKVLQPESKMIRNVFAIERRGEAERMKQFQDYKKKLLWHGSGVQNFLSILSFGLRINGIQAQKSGSSLGDGIYFSDLFAKASNYANNMDVGVSSRFLLLCEVAVGKDQQIKNQEHYNEFVKQNYQLLKGFNSIKLVGNNCPDEKKNLILPNGTIVPIGSIIDFNEELKQKLATKKQGKSAAKKKAPKKGKAPKPTKTQFGGARVMAVPRMMGGMAPRKQLATVAVRMSAPAPRARDIHTSEDEEDNEVSDVIQDEETISEELVNDNDNEQEIGEEDEKIDDGEEIAEENEDDEDDEDNEEEDDEDNDANYNQNNNFLYNVTPQGPKTPFNQLFTQYQQSEYVVFNAAQVRIRYLVEIQE